MVKNCCTCRQSKPLTAFSKDRGKSDGLSHRCKTCSTLSGKEWRKNNAARARQHGIEYRAANIVHIKAANRKRMYGTDGVELLKQQEAKCAICSVDLETIPEKHRHVDHDHINNVVRGWLCRWCNLGLGKFRDDPVLLQKAADYLKRRR